MLIDRFVLRRVERARFWLRGHSDRTLVGRVCLVPSRNRGALYTHVIIISIKAKAETLRCLLALEANTRTPQNAYVYLPCKPRYSREFGRRYTNSRSSRPVCRSEHASTRPPGY